MGGTNSTANVLRGSASTAVFNSNEDQRMSTLFESITGVKSDKSAEVTNEQLMAYCGAYFSDVMCTRLYLLMKDLSPSDKTTNNAVQFVNFQRLLACLLKGTVEQKVKAICFLSSGRHTDLIEHQQLEFIFTELVTIYEQHVTRSEMWSSWKHMHSSEESRQRFVEHLLQDLPDPSKGHSLHMDSGNHHLVTVDMIETWFEYSSISQHLFNLIFNIVFPVRQVPIRSLIPQCLPDSDGNPISTMLDLHTITLINHHLMATQWRLLYCSQLHGESFSMLVHRVLNRGPTVLVVRDRQGHVFGGFASREWTIGPQFKGHPRCFLFSASPNLNVYSASNHNTNFMYLNQGQETLPNGLGMGGQLNYFGLWLDAQYGVGHSKAKPTCTTYNSPQLSAMAEFTVDRIEVWGIGAERKRHSTVSGEDGEELEQEEGVVTSVLDNDLESKAMLTLLNRGPVSEGLRESDCSADTPDTHNLR